MISEITGPRYFPKQKDPESRGAFENYEKPVLNMPFCPTPYSPKRIPAPERLNLNPPMPYTLNLKDCEALNRLLYTLYRRSIT